MKKNTVQSLRDCNFVAVRSFPPGIGHGTPHPNERVSGSVYFTVASPRGFLSGYVDADVFPLLERALEVRS